jgi:hypothetical protein
MTLMPDPGTYIVGDLETDGHTHVFVMGTHVLDQRDPGEEPSLIPGDFPRATTAGANEGAEYPHAHSIQASSVADKTFLCRVAENHMHSVFTKQK